MTHANQLPRVVSARLAPSGRLIVMVPVRSEEHTRALLDGLESAGLRARTSRVDAAWVAATVALQLGRAAAAGLSAEAAAAVSEGEILFVEAARAL